jgi:Zn finger protein HypA/HybF involved in hydrogenase expression
MKVALVDCRKCHQVTAPRLPVQRYCPACSQEMKRMRSQQAMARRRLAVNDVFGNYT